MSDVKETAERISTERLEAMMAGLEGVTPGPWVYGSKYLGAYVNGDRSHYLRIARDGAENSYDGDLWNRNAAHIAGCDPDTMRSILTELLASRADAQEAGEVAGQLNAAWLQGYEKGQVAAPSNPVVSDEFVEKLRIQLLRHREVDIDASGLKAALFDAALSVNPQSGSDKP